MKKLVEKELSYKIVGILFDVYNHLGGGYQEKYYQRAVSKGLKESNFHFVEQVHVPLDFKGESIGRYFIDFVIGRKVVLEIKAASKFYVRDIRQVLSYLNSANIELGILANFSRDGLQIKRLLRGYKIRDN